MLTLWFVARDPGRRIRTLTGVERMTDQSGTFTLPLPSPSSAWRIVWAAFVVAGLIAMSEIDRLISDVVGETGRSVTLGQVVGPSALGERARGAWETWKPAAAQVPEAELSQLIGWHVFWDLVFVAAVVALLWFGLLRSVPGAGPARGCLWIYAGAEAVEAVLLAGAAAVLESGVPSWLTWVLAGASTAKWVSVAALVLAVLGSRVLRMRLWRAMVRAGRALFVQRLSFVVVALIAALALVPSGGVFDQLPDVQRGWLDALGDKDNLPFLTSRGFWHMICAVLAVLLGAIGLFLLGRQRAERAWTTEVGMTVPKGAPSYVWWLIGPAVVGVVAVSMDGELVDRQTVGVFVLVPLTLVAGSALLRIAETRLPDSEQHIGKWRAVGYGVAVVLLGGLAVWFLIGDRSGVSVAVLVAAVALMVGSGVMAWRVARETWTLPAEPDPEARRTSRAVDVLRAGDLLALALVLVGCLALIRSFVAPALLPVEGDGGRHAWQVALVVVAIVVLIAAPVGGVCLVMALDEGELTKRPRLVALHRLMRPDHRGWLAAPAGQDATEHRSVLQWIVPAGMAVVAAIGLVLLMLWPREIVNAVGTVAVTVAALGAWAILIGFLVVHLQQWRPLEVFRLVGLRANPVLTLLALVLVVVTTAGGDPDVHSIRTDAALSAPAATPLERPEPSNDAFDAWLARSAACDQELPGTAFTARPLLLVAASGGGIRAAVWTTHVMEKIAETPCGAGVTLLSSGVSGGSVGLALTRGADYDAAAERLAEPTALSMGIVGTLVSDLVAVTTGLRVPALVDGQRHWFDRAGLMESVWQDAAPVLRNTFDAQPVGPAGALVLNSTAADSSCRVLVGQVDLRPAPADHPADCRQDLAGPPAASLDLVELWDECPRGMTWATAAMLSARFPYVTPAGRLPLMAEGCERLPDAQLIAGGYAESSGIGTLADVAPTVTGLVRRHNAEVINAGQGALVVPFMIYLEDETRRDLEIPVPRLAPEVLVPIVGGGAEELQAASGTWTQRVAEAIADPCPRPDDTICGAAVRQLRAAIPQGVVVAAPLTRAAVDPPLGWTLSADSRERLDLALADQAGDCRGPDVQGYPCLKALLDVLKAGG